MTAYLLGAGMKEIDTSGLKVGQYVSYEDQANPRCEAIVIDEKGDYGQVCIAVDLSHKSNVSITAIEGPGGWRLVDKIATLEEIKTLQAKFQGKQIELMKKREEEQKRREEREKQGKLFFESVKPPWANAVIVGEQEIDDCDLMTDYFSTKTGKQVVLAWSRHTKDIFSEMRKAAGNSPETSHLAENIKENEHREKHSMGAGYYLKASGRYSTGWKVEKHSLSKWYLSSLHMILSNKENYKVTIQKETPQAEGSNGVTMTLNEEKDGVELTFTDKPSEEIRENLKANGFRWSRYQSLWYAKQSTVRLEFAKSLI